MKFLQLLSLIVFTFTSFATAATQQLTQKEKDLIIRIQAKEQNIAKTTRANDKLVAANVKQKESDLRATLKSLNLKSKYDLKITGHGDCDDTEVPDVGQDKCWEACTKEGWGSSTCSSRCGIDNSTGSENCWDTCSKEGWSSSTCASRCGTDTSGGESSCWESCSKEGWGSSTCSSRCGTDTSGGEAGCWDSCTKEGWGSSTCQSRCSSN